MTTALYRFAVREAESSPETLRYWKDVMSTEPA